MVAEPMDAFDQHAVTEDAVAETAPDALPPSAATDASAHAVGQPHAGAPASSRRRSMGVTDDAAEGPQLRAFAGRHASPQVSANHLAAAIEATIVPRLVMAHGTASDDVVHDADPALAASVPALVVLLLEDDADAAMAMLLRLRAGGSGIEAICLDLLAPAARRLGSLWTEDDCDFATVTLAVARLRRAMHELAPLATARAAMDARRTALIAAAPGEQHVFGIAMVGDFLRRAGWDVLDAIGLEQAQLVRTVRQGWFAVAALSASGERQLDALAISISAIRAASRHRAIRVMVGGQIFTDQPALALRVGADATASDARMAVRQAERLVAGERNGATVRARAGRSPLVGVRAAAGSDG